MAFKNSSIIEDAENLAFNTEVSIHNSNRCQTNEREMKEVIKG